MNTFSLIQREAVIRLNTSQTSISAYQMESIKFISNLQFEVTVGVFQKLLDMKAKAQKNFVSK